MTINKIKQSPPQTYQTNNISPFKNKVNDVKDDIIHSNQISQRNLNLNDIIYSMIAFNEINFEKLNDEDKVFSKILTNNLLNSLKKEKEYNVPENNELIKSESDLLKVIKIQKTWKKHKNSQKSLKSDLNEIIKNNQKLTQLINEFDFIVKELANDQSKI